MITQTIPHTPNNANSYTWKNSNFSFSMHLSKSLSQAFLAFIDGAKNL